MIFATYSEESCGVHVYMHRNNDITKDIEEMTGIISSFRKALYDEVPSEIADMIIATIGKLAYARDSDDKDAVKNILMELDGFMRDDFMERYGYDIEDAD